MTKTTTSTRQGVAPSNRPAESVANASETRNRKQSFLVAGGAGFVGSHLCERLLQQGHSVLCVDNFHTGRWANIEHLAVNRHFSVIDQDIIEPLPELHRMDGIFNLACPASPPMYQADPIWTVKTNVIGSLNLLELAHRHNARILQASTSEVYGDPKIHPQPETYLGNVNPIGPRACYDEGKRCAETLFFDYARTRKTEIKVARIFNTYGPRMRPDDGRVVSNFITQALQGKEITIHGTGTQTRSFCYVDDLVEGLMKLMWSPAAVTGPFNLGNPHESTINDIAELIVSMTGSRSRLTYVPRPQDDPELRRPDISKAKRELDWRPRTPLVEGLNQTIVHFEKALGTTPAFLGAAE